MKILLVDDHPLFLDGLKTLLTVRGMEAFCTARDGLEALEKAWTQVYDGGGDLIGVARNDYTRPYNSVDAIRYNPIDVYAWH